MKTMERRPELYRKYEAYVIGSELNVSVQFHFEDWLCFPIIVEVSKLYNVLYVASSLFDFILYYTP